MYTSVLALHSALRWLAILTGILATFAAFTSRSSPGPRDRAESYGLLFVTALDLQLLIGLLLYFVLSPITAAVRENFGAAMHDPAARFWAVEHVSTMLIAVVLVHVGRVLGRKAPTPPARRTRLLICFGLALIALLFATPWPGMPNGRPLFRSFGL
jgi:hypothetical protein